MKWLAGVTHSAKVHTPQAVHGNKGAPLLAVLKCWEQKIHIIKEGSLQAIEEGIWKSQVVAESFLSWVTIWITFLQFVLSESVILKKWDPDDSDNIFVSVNILLRVISC